MDTITTRDTIGEPIPRGTLIKSCPFCKTSLGISIKTCPVCGHKLEEQVMSKVNKLMELLEGITEQEDEIADSSLDDLLDVLNSQFNMDFEVVDSTFNMDSSELTVSVSPELPAVTDELKAELADIFGTIVDKVNVVGSQITVSDVYSTEVPEEAFAVDYGSGILLKVGESLYQVEDMNIDDLKDAEFDVEEAMVKMVKDGKVVTKNIVPGKKKRRLTPKQKAALAKARKKAWSPAAKKARMKSMAVRQRAGL